MDPELTYIFKYHLNTWKFKPRYKLCVLISSLIIIKFKQEGKKQPGSYPIIPDFRGVTSRGFCFSQTAPLSPTVVPASPG